MKQLFPLFGIVTVLNTPFTNEYEINLAALKKNVNEAIADKLIEKVIQLENKMRSGND